MKRIAISLIALVLMHFSTGALAQIPRVINYQGMLLGSDEQLVPEGDYKITFNLYDDANNLQWSEVHNNVFVGGGMFHVLLGTVNPLNIPFDIPYFLGIQVGNDPELQPRMMMTSAAYSFRAEDADKVAGIAISPTPQPNMLLPLDASGKFPASVLSDGADSGNFLRKNEPDTSRATTSSPLLLVSNLGSGDGINGRSTNGDGISGRSENRHGAVGWTAASDKSGVFGHSTNGIGVEGFSNANDGVVGYSPQKSGVFGHSQNGIGITGRSEGSDGILGVTTSSNAGHAAVHARNEGSGPAVYSEGDLYVTGKHYGNIGSSKGAPFPRPAYDSGWVAVTVEDYWYTTLPVDQYLPTSQYNNDNFYIDILTKSGGFAGNTDVGADHVYFLIRFS